MKQLFLLLAACSILFSCQKNGKDLSTNNATAPGQSGPANKNANPSNSAGFISFVGGVFKLIGGNSDSIQISMTQAAPLAGWTISLASSDPAVQVPATAFVSFEALLFMYLLPVPLLPARTTL